MAGYLTAISLAKRMGAADVVNLLQQSLAEEQNAEKKLRSIASGLIKSAATEEALAAQISVQTGGRSGGRPAPDVPATFWILFTHIPSDSNAVATEAGLA
jgi:hypothetical protein